MINDQSIPVTAKTTIAPMRDRDLPAESTPVARGADGAPAGYVSSSALCWAAIIGGTVAAIGLHMLFSALGAGAGLALFEPVSDTNPVAHFSVGAAIIWSLCAVVALAVGGFVAGRFSRSTHSGLVHGILVWSLTLIITVLLLSIGTSMVFGGAMKLAGAGLGIGAQAAASSVAEITKQGVNQTGAQLTSFIDEAVQSGATNATPQAATRAKREIGFAVGKLFAPGNDVTNADNRAALKNALVEYGQISAADADKTIEQWAASYNNLKAEVSRLTQVAERKARVAADQAASNAATAGIWAFFALLIGLAVTALAGRFGAQRALLYQQLEWAEARGQAV